jgi:thymidine phosphorylase
LSEDFSAVDVIRTKRDGHALSSAQIAWVIDAYTRGVVAEEQMSALAMAIFLRGMDPRETSRWTEAMVRSGERMDFSTVPRPTVDKHSTGGVGDKITLPLVPLVAACGAAVPQLSGRGLGHTGGTLDKMEAIPGWRAQLTNSEILRILTDVGGVICAAGEGLAPADRKLYALRDVTATVESIPLIASSIMSKKIAEGTDALVLDVKTGRGAFMSDPEDAVALARTMVRIGTDEGMRVRALVTAMDVPLGRGVGNALEVAEAVEVLAGGGPEDVVALTLELARHMLDLVGIDTDPAQVLASGAAMDSWREMVRAQGGDPDAPLPSARVTETVRAVTSGIVLECDALAIGRASWLLGAGRARREDSVSATAGIEVLVKPGDTVSPGDPLLVLHTDEPSRLPRAFAELGSIDEPGGALTIGAPDTPVQRLPLVLDVIDAADTTGDSGSGD